MKLRDRLAAVECENRALKEQLEVHEQVLQPPVGAAAAEHGLLDYAKTMSMRPPSHTPTASEGHGVSRKPRQPLAGSSSQWVHDVINFSSQRDAQGYGAHQLVGPPRVFPMHGHVLGAWQPAAVARGEESKEDFVELEMATSMFVSGLEIYETFYAGSCVKVSIWDAKRNAWDAVWRGEAQPLPSLHTEARLFTPELESREYATQHVRLDLRIFAHPTRADSAAQIDAVRILGVRTAVVALGTAPKRLAAGRAPPQLPAGPRYRRAEEHARLAETEVAMEREAHQREVAGLRSYIDRLRGHGAELQAELDLAKEALAAGK